MIDLAKLTRREILRLILDKVTQVDIKATYIMASQAEEAVRLQGIQAELVHIGEETQTLIDRINDLVALQGQATPELSAAIDAVSAQAHVVDDLVPDAPVNQ